MAKKQSTNETVIELKSRMRKLGLLAKVIEDFEESNECDSEKIADYEQRIANGEELDRWDKQDLTDRKADIKAREELIATLAKLTF